MEHSRMRKALSNTYAEIGLEVVTAICSFILPRLILSSFGSAYNGITASISQFISVIALMKSGIGSVTRAALYKPLSERDSFGISAVANATEQFMRRIALVFLVGIGVFSVIYPLFVSKDFDWVFASSLVIVLSLSTFAQYYFGLTYQMIIQADQRNYIISCVQIAATIMNTLICALLIKMGFGIHGVKLGSAFVFIVPPFFYRWYAKRHYHLDKSVPSNLALISQRWDAFAHQLANFINTNTDIIVITVFLGVGEVSVYSVYYMVCNAVRKVVLACSSGITAAFGNMIAKEEYLVLRKRYSQFELLIYYITTVLYTTTAVLLIPFIKVYTMGITDVNYVRTAFGLLICVAEFFSCVKIPCEQLAFAAGKFKETRNGAFIEAGINIAISLLTVKMIGIEGVVIGTIIAISYRVFRYDRFVSQNILKRSCRMIIKHLSFSVVSAVVCILIGKSMIVYVPQTLIEWFVLAVPTFICIGIVISLVAFLFFRGDFSDTIKYLIGQFTRRMGKKRK